MNSTLQETILIIDDDPYMRGFAVAVLEDAGYITKHADNAVKGVVAAMESQPSLILLDYAMPVNDGIEVIKGLTQIDWLSSTPVIVMSAWQSDSVKERVIAFGASWLDKPVSADALVAAVKQRLSF